MSATATPGDRGKTAKKALALILGGMLSLLALAGTSVLSDARPKGLTCSKAADQSAKAITKIAEVNASKDLSENEKSAQVTELTKEANVAGDYWTAHHCKDQSKDGTTTTTDAGKDKSKDDGDKSDSKDTTTTTAASSTGTGSGTANDPHVGTAGNTQPLLDTPSTSWTGIDKAATAAGDEGYWAGVEARKGIKPAEVKQALGREKKGKGLGVVLFSNTNMTDAQGRDKLTSLGVPDAQKMPMLRVQGFWNTRHTSHGVERFWDPRSQVRLLLLTPHDYDAFVKHNTMPPKGLLGMCGNDVDFGPPPAPPVTVPHTTPTAPPAPPVTVPPPPPVTTTTRPRPPSTTTTTIAKGTEPDPCVKYPSMPGC